MLESFYNQIVKTGDAIPRLYGRASKFGKNPVIDYVNALQPWLDNFGVHNLIIRNYESLIDNNIYADFFCAIQNSAAGSFDNSEIRRNPRIPNALIELKRLSNLTAPNAALQKSLDRALRLVIESLQLPNDTRIDVLSPDDRRFLFEHTRSLNDDLRVLFLETLNHPFFPEPENILFSPPNAITDRQAALRYAGILNLCLSHVIGNEELSASQRRKPAKPNQ
jgi:hypothetical protein